MMVPSNRLIFWSAMTLFPATLLAAFVPAAAGAAALLACALPFFACWDAWRGAALLDGLTCSVAAVTRLTCRRDGVIDLALAYPPALRGCRLRLALEADEAVGLLEEEQACRLPEETDEARLGWSCRPHCRGLYGVRLVACEADAPWGLWRIIRRRPLTGEVRVYPDLREERRKAPSVFLRRGSVGAHLRRQAGKGREFEKLREYVAGDDMADIHWKATARRRFPVTKVFQLERTQDVYVVLDLSRLSGRPLGEEGERTVLEQNIRSALTLVLAAERLGDRCGLLTFHRRVVTFLPAAAGKRHFDACRNALYTASTEPVSPDFQELFSFIRARLPKRALFLFLTQLDSPALAEPFLQSLRLVARHHLLVVPLLTTREARPLFSGAPAGDPDAIRRELAGHLQWRQLKELERAFRRCGVRTALAPADQATAALVSLYLLVKERQLL